MRPRKSQQSGRAPRQIYPSPQASPQFKCEPSATRWEDLPVESRVDPIGTYADVKWGDQLHTHREFFTKMMYTFKYPERVKITSIHFTPKQ